MKTHVNYLAIFLSAAPLLTAQVSIGSRTAVTGAVIDLSTAGSTRPVKAGSILPGACQPPDLFFHTAAAAGKNLFLCTAANVWTEVQGTGVISDPVTAPAAISTNAPVLGNNNDRTVKAGAASGSTTEFGTVSGTKTQNKQLAFDASGNIVASSTDIGGGGGAASIHGGLIINSVPASGTRYWFPCNGCGFSASEGSSTIALPRAGTLKRLLVKTSGTQPSTGSMVICARDSDAFATSSLCATVPASGGAGAYSDTANSLVLASGKRASLQFINNAAATSATILEVSLVIE